MSLACMFGGLAINLADCSAEHALGHGLGGVYGLPHGLAVGLRWPSAWRRTGRPGRGARAHRRGARRARRRRRRRHARHPRRPPRARRRRVPGLRRAIGVGDERMADLVAISLDDYCLTTNPVPVGCGRGGGRVPARARSHGPVISTMSGVAPTDPAPRPVHRARADGRRQRDARLVLRRRAVPRPGRRDRGGAPPRRRGRGDRRRGRRVDAAGSEGISLELELERVLPVIEGIRAGATWRSRSTPPRPSWPSRDPRRCLDGERRDRSRRPGDGRPRRPSSASTCA